MSAPLAFAEPAGAVWLAQLKLRFTERYGKTVLQSRSHHGPLLVQRPFYPEGAVCHIYIIHPPGGVVGGDQLEIELEADSGSHALLTTPAASKFYRSDGRTAQQKLQIRVANGAVMEWLPQETLVFDHARLVMNNKLQLEAGARLLAWEVLVFGRPAASEGFTEGWAQMSWRLELAGKALLNEKLRMDAAAFQARWGLGGANCCGTLLAYPAGRAELEMVRQLLAEEAGYGVSLLDELLVCRGMAQRADQLSTRFRDIWQCLRLSIVKRPAVSPRIWAT